MSKDNKNNNKNINNIARYASFLPLVLGIVVKVFSMLWLALGVRIVFVVFLLIGASLVVYWLYRNGVLSRNSKNGISRAIEKKCICSICKHEQGKLCLQRKCPCCLIMKRDTIIGHANNPLQ